MTFYQNYIIQDMIDKSKRTPHATFAPSSFRCDRKSWFRLRSVEPDKLSRPDPVSQFKADIGTSCHRIIQQNLKNSLGEDWVDVEEYFQDNPPNFKYKLVHDDFECRLEVEDPPVRFACDGIIRWKGLLYLLEIKTLEYVTLEELTNPMNKHLDQVKFYGVLCNIPRVMFFYQDRQYGGIKCYEICITEAEQKAIWGRIADIRHKAANNLAPDRLPKGDDMCTYCEYKLKCSEWG